MANDNSKKVKNLLRRFNVFQSWRIGEPPFENRPDFYSDTDVNNLLDEVATCLGEYAVFLDGVTPNMCNCDTSKSPTMPFPKVQFVSADELFKHSPEMAKQLREAFIHGVGKSESDSSTSGMVETSANVPEVVDIMPPSPRNSEVKVVDKPSTVSVAPSGRPAAKGISPAFTDNTPFIVEEN